MILKLLLITAALFCGLAVVLIVAPFNAIVDFSFKDFRPAGSGDFSFLHPLFFAAQVDFAARRFSVRILGRLMGGKRKPVSGSGLPADTGRPEGERLDTEDAPSGNQAGFTGDIPFGQPDRKTVLPPSRPREVAPVPPPEQTAPPPFASPDRSIRTEPPPEVVTAPEQEKKDNWYRRLQRNRYLFFLRNTAWRNKVVRWTVRVVRTLFRIVKFDRFRLAIRAGVEDPMVTGTIAGLHQAVVYGLTMKKPYAISFEPVFMTDCFSCSGGLRLGTSPGRLLLPVVVAIATFPFLHTLRLVWRWYRMEQKRKRSAAV